MITELYANELPSRIFLGRQGENGFRSIAFNWEAWKNDYPSGALTVVIKRPDGAIYPALTGAAASPAVWRLTDTDLGVPGIAEIELRLYVGEMLGKSAVMQGVIAASLGTPAEPPEAVPDWVGDVACDADRAEAARTAIEDMTVSAAALPAGSEPTVTKTSGSVVNLEFGIPVGGSGGTDDHSQLANRDAADQHPQSAITGLTEALAEKYVRPSGGIPETDLAQAVQDDIAAGASAYQRPAGGIPAADLAGGVQASLTAGAAAYQKPAGGIPASDMAQAVQTSLDKADTALQSVPDLSAVYVTASQGAGNAGKVLGINANGSVEPVAAGGSDSDVLPWYRLISDITISEEVNNIRITQDGLGNAFKLREIAIRIDYVQPSSPGNSTCYIETSNNRYDGSFAVTSATGEHNIVIIRRLTDSFAEFTFGSGSTFNASYRQQYSKSSAAAPLIEYVRIYYAAFGIGTRITVWGR